MTYPDEDNSVIGVLGALVVFALVAVLLYVMVGCRNIDRHYVAADSGDINGDGEVNEIDWDLLTKIVYGDLDPPDTSDPFPVGDCNRDGFVTLEDASCLFERLCYINRCGDKCKLKLPRHHKCKGQR